MTVVDDGRRAAEALMTDTFAAYSPGGATTDADGMETTDLVPEGSTFGRLRSPGRADIVTQATASVGGVVRPILFGALRIPIRAPAPGVGWEYVMTSAGPDTDPGLVGRRWHVVGLQAASAATARRLDVVEV